MECEKCSVQLPSLEALRCHLWIAHPGGAHSDSIKLGSIQSMDDNQVNIATQQYRSRGSYPKTVKEALLKVRTTGDDVTYMDFALDESKPKSRPIKRHNNDVEILPRRKSRRIINTASKVTTQAVEVDKKPAVGGLSVCGLCNRKFASDHELESHLLNPFCRRKARNVLIPKKPPSIVRFCEICQGKFTSDLDLNEHIKLLHPRQWYKRQLEANRIVTANKSVTIKQETCPEIFKSGLDSDNSQFPISPLRKPESSSEEDEPGVYFCHQCVYQCSSKLELGNHLKQLHFGIPTKSDPETALSSKQAGENVKICYCEVCLGKFSNNIDFMNHVKLLHPKYYGQLQSRKHESCSEVRAKELQVYYCHLCVRKCSSKIDLENHLQLAHSKLAPKPNPQYVLSSSQGFNLATSDLQKGPILSGLSVPKSASGARFCEVCQGKFYSNEDLLEHMKNIHPRHVQKRSTGIVPGRIDSVTVLRRPPDPPPPAVSYDMICPVCLQTFTSFIALQKHMQTHLFAATTLTPSITSVVPSTSTQTVNRESNIMIYTPSNTSITPITIQPEPEAFYNQQTTVVQAITPTTWQDAMSPETELMLGSSLTQNMSNSSYLRGIWDQSKVAQTVASAQGNLLPSLGELEFGGDGDNWTSSYIASLDDDPLVPLDESGLDSEELLAHCSECGLVLMTDDIKTSHLLYHQRSRPHSCDDCVQGFSSSEELNKHLLHVINSRVGAM